MTILERLINEKKILKLLFIFSYIIIGKPIDTSEIMTTNKSSILNKLRQNAPSWSIIPYEMSLRQISMVNTLVKK